MEQVMLSRPLFSGESRSPGMKAAGGRLLEDRDETTMTDGHLLEGRITTDGHLPEDHVATDGHLSEDRVMTAVPKTPPDASAHTKLMSSWGAFKMLPKYLLGEKGEGKRGLGTLFLM